MSLHVCAADDIFTVNLPRNTTLVVSVGTASRRYVDGATLERFTAEVAVSELTPLDLYPFDQ